MGACTEDMRYRLNDRRLDEMFRAWTDLRVPDGSWVVDFTCQRKWFAKETVRNWWLSLAHYLVVHVDHFTWLVASNGEVAAWMDGGHDDYKEGAGREAVLLASWI